MQKAAFYFCFIPRCLILARIKFDFALIKLISLFQSITRVDVKDCFETSEGTLVFVVGQGQIGKAIGKGSSNVKRLESKFKKKIRIIEYNPDMEQFVRNMVYPNKLNEVEFDHDKKVLTLTAMDNKTRGYLIGRSASNLRNYESILKRHFDVSELKVK